MAHASVSKGGKDQIVKTLNARTIVLAMVSALSNRCTVLGNAFATLVGAVLVVNVLPCTRNSRLAQIIAQGTVCA